MTVSPLCQEIRRAPRAKPGIEAIQPYVPGKSHVAGVADPVKLSANENILGCGPFARRAYEEAAANLGRYPDGRGVGLRAALAARYAIEPERIILGCGTDEIFALLNQTYLEPGDNIVQGEFGFGAYAIGARANQAEVRYAPEPHYRIDVGALLEAVDERTRLVFIANPANPTGTFITDAELRRCTTAFLPTCCWCSTAPTPNSIATRPSRTVWTMARERRTSSSPTPSPNCMAWPR